MPIDIFPTPYPVVNTVISISAFLSAGAVIYKMILAPLGGKIQEFWATWKELTDTIPKIHNELKPNGGLSLWDRIKRIEDALENNKSRMDLFFYAHPIAVFEIDAQGKWVIGSQKWFELTGSSPKEVYSKGWFDVFTPDSKHEIIEDLRSAAAYGTNFSGTYQLVNGKTCEIKATAILNHQDESIRGYIGHLIIHRNNQ